MDLLYQTVRISGGLLYIAFLFVYLRVKILVRIDKQEGMDVSQSDKGKVKTTVEIYNRSYTIVGNEDDRHVREVAGRVDGTMRGIIKNNPRLDTAKLAVLTAVNTMSDYIKLKKDYDELMSYIQKLEKEAGD